VSRIDQLRRLASDMDALRPSRPAGTSTPPGGSFTPAKTWTTTTECRAAALAASMQTASTRNGVLPRDGLTRSDVVDRSFAALAATKLKDPRTPAEERAIALDVIVAWAGAAPKWDSLLRSLAAQGDVTSLRTVLDQKITQSSALGPELVVALWQVEDARASLANALARNAGDDWSARATACERAAQRAGLSVDGLFEAWALAIVEHSASATAAETGATDQLRIVIREAIAKAAPIRAVAFYEDMLDEYSASLFLRAMKRVPRDRAAALRDAAGKLRFLGERGAARKAWLLDTRRPKDLKKRRSSSID
jgi:hypothetical protein